MPNYRQKNKKNKNKNRQKNQQQQHQQQENKNKNQNPQQPEIQQTDQNRQPTNNQDNQSQGQSRREQSNQQQQQQQTTTPPQSPKSPTPTATQTTPAASEDEARAATSPQQQPPSSEDAREVDSDAPAAALKQCHNLNSNEPTTSHQTFTTAVEREECNRVEDADAQLSKLDNKEATHIDIARIEGIVGVECDSAVQESTMGNKDSKAYITSDDDAATTATATTATVTASTDLCGMSRPDRTIAGARELDELHTVVPKTQMAKVIVHRIVRETTSEGGENEQRIGDIDKVEQVASVSEKLTSEKTGELKVEVTDEQKAQVMATDGQIEGFAQQKQVQSTTKEVETVNETQQPKVIVHKIEQKPLEVRKADQPNFEPKVILHAIQQEEDELTVKQQLETSDAQTTRQTPQSNAGAKVIVHKIAQPPNDNAGASQIQRDEADNSRVTATNAACISPKGRPEQIDDSKVIIHHIQLESTSPINYRVDSPDTESPTSQLYRSKQAQLLNKSIVQIQELSDESSSEYNDNPPVISEAESETESTAGACALDYPQAVRTLSPGSENSYDVSRKPPAIPSQEQQDLKQRRAQKRVALETHFLPQLLSPRYLDSIMEENSDMSDARSDCSENPLMTTHSGDDLHDASASKVRKANEVFPRSNLDFTRRHAKKQLGALPKKPLPIREEPVAMVVAAKLIDNAITPAQECCTRLSSEHTPESEAAEVIYLSSSASSSLSDLMELDAEGDGDDECGNSSRSTIDLDTDAREIITRPGSEECAATASDSRESTPVNQTSTRLSENNETQKIHTNNNNNASGWVEQATPAAAAVNGTNIDTAKITNPIEHRIFENLKSLQLLAEPSGERALSNGSGSGETITSTTTTSISKRTITTHSESETETSSETTTERCEYLRSSSSSGNGSGSSSLTSSIDAKYPPAIIATSDSLNVDPAVLLENIELEMNSVRDILNSHTIETTATTCGNQHVSDTRTSCELKNIDKFNSAKNVSPSPPPIPPPPTSASASDFHSDFTGFQTQSAPQPPPPIPARAPQDNTFNSATTLTTEQKSPQTQTTNTLYPNTHNALTTLSLLSRQESAESHCSDSTQHSQCTAINVGSRPSTDHELTPPLTAISPISDAQQQRQHIEWKYGENCEIDANARGQQNDLELPSAEQKDAAIKKLRLLCTETLASMPYGEQVLVELATVAQNIGELQAKAPTQTPAAEKSSALPQGTTHVTNMPYPLPQLPHISELQLSIAADERTPTTPSEPKRAQTSHSAISSHTTSTHNVAITQRSDPVGASRDLTAASAKLLHSPPAPPVPAPPARYSDAPWLGVPTAADPNVLVCLSPAQQQQLTAGMQSSQQAGAQQTPQPDQLLDAHQKFLERRGYHEYTDEQVKSLNAELQQEEQQILKTAAYMKKLRKSLTPPPPPVPPPPVPAKNAETAAKAQNQARIAAASSSHVSSDHSQRVYDVIQDRNANEQIAGTFANGEQQRQQIQANQSEQKRLLTLIQNADAPADAVAVSVDGSSSTTSSACQQTSSLENNSRQTSAADAAAATAAAQGGAPALAGKQPTASAETRQYSNANESESTSISRVSDLYAANNYTKNSFPTTTKPTSTSSVNMQGVESELAKMFPSMGSSDIFDSNRKRFSNIESSTASKDGAYCAQLQSTLPKRYSNIETHSYEAKKRMENGQVVYDYSDSRHERQSDGDKSLESASTPSLLQFPVREPSKEYLQYPVAGDGVSSRSGNSEIMSAIKLNTTESAKTTTQETNVETKEQTNGINMTNFVHPAATSNATASSTAATTQHNPTDRTFGSTATTTETTIKEEHIKNSQEFGSSTARPQASSGGGDSGNAYEEFRQRAKAAADGGALGAFGGQTPATAPPLGQGNSKHSAFNFQHDKLFKDFDALSQQLHMELEEGKAQRQQREKSASLFDLNRTQWNFKDHFDELKQQRHQHMQELEREIERSMRSRQLKGWANGGAQNATTAPATGRTYEIPIQIEQNNGAYDNTHSNGFARKSDRSSAPRELIQPHAYNIPIVMENGDAPVPPPPPADYDTVDDASRFRRAESMFNLSENTRRAQPQTPQTYATYERPKSAAADDWARYASDFGSSENITRPFAREVEICYQRQRPRTIRAPRLSASTNDLSSYTHSYDNYNAYNARRSHAPMLQPVAQQQRPHHGSCYSVLERDPNPTYISTTTRRGVSPAPVSPAPHAAAQEPLYSPHAPERQRRASLPREIQEQQLKYISSKEEELRMEFERLQNERRRLMDELNTPPTPTLQMPQHPMRDIYRPVPKLPTLTEDEVFRQQMAEEWLSKVAEREERRLQKIIKISKVNETQQGQQPPVPPHPKPDISDEFLKRVQERRTKLAMPADSDWESGAESQPARAGHASESDAEVPPVKVIEGKSEADLRQLPRHLREFARFSNHNEEKIDGGHRVVHQEEERRQEANGNSMSSALKKSSVVKTVKIARPEIVTNTSQRVAPPPVSVQQQQQPRQQPQQGHSRPTSGGETVVTRRSHISTATSSTRSSYETHAKLQQSSISRTGGAAGGAMGGVNPQQQPHSHLKHHNQQQQHQHHHHHQHSHSHKASSSSRPPAPHVRTCKKTRFLLEPNRRSWSESDLLKEIDSELKLAKGFLYANGIWTPGTQTPNTSFTNLNDIHPKVSTPTPPPPPLPAHGVGQTVWTPQPSPTSGRKEFRPVRFESPTLPRRYVVTPQSNDGTAQIPPPWRQSATTTDGDSSYAAPSPRSAYSYTNLSTPTTTIGSAGSTNYCDSIPSESSLLNHVGTGPSQSVADKIKTFERSASTSALYSPAARRRHDIAQPFYKPNEVIFKVKHEYMSEPETEHDHPRKMAQLGRRQVDGIGPVTNDGMPIILRSEVKEPHKHEWYKRLYQTIHKQKSGDDYVIRYKCQRARPQLKTTGYQSEPEPNYDSDYSTVKYRTLDRRRLQSVSSATNVANRHTNIYQDDKLYGTMPNPIKSEQNQYKNQPGRIEDYVTGRSSVSEKERKEWWDEVMDIFNGHLEQTKLSPHYTEGNLSRALAKESGYASDSNLVFRKRDVPQASPLSPVEQKQAYKSVQAGGEPPLFGFRKPAPERPKESPNRYLESDVNIHFKTPIRHEYKQAMSDEDLAQRQAEQMQKLYQEERRRKYLQELQDMNARRHTDNFTPTQKSPIPLNRYDDFQSDLAPKSPNAITTRTAARALYNFQGQNARELTFKKGDIIYIRRQIDRNWYEGEFNAMIGLLPVSYVEVVNKETARQQPKKPSEGQARAKYNFQAQSGIELSLNKGELVTLTRRVDDNWFEGKIANRKGIFPVSYVEVLTDIGAEDIAARTVITEQASVTNLRPSLDTLRTNINNEFNLITKNGHQPPNGILKETKHHNNKIDALHVDTHSEPLVYRALYKYRPQNSDEMELLEGDIVHVLEICDDGWFVGTSQRTGCFGTFPGNYVERVR